MSNNLGDRRREDRKVVMAFTLVYENGKLLGYLRDLTLRGAQVNGEKTMQVNTQTTLSIDLPGDLPGINVDRVHIPARVVRCHKQEDSATSYEIGFEFKELQQEQIQIIDSLLERYHFRHKLY
jgi:hypothetical protein